MGLGTCEIFIFVSGDEVKTSLLMLLLWLKPIIIITLNSVELSQIELRVVQFALTPLTFIKLSTPYIGGWGSGGPCCSRFYKNVACFLQSTEKIQAKSTSTEKSMNLQSTLLLKSFQIHYFHILPTNMVLFDQNCVKICQIDWFSKIFFNIIRI